MGCTQLIVALTGNSMLEELHDFARAGADLVLTKPLRQPTLEVLLKCARSRGTALEADTKWCLRDKEIVCVSVSDYFDPTFKLEAN